MRVLRRDAIGEKEPAWENRPSHITTGPRVAGEFVFSKRTGVCHTASPL